MTHGGCGSTYVRATQAPKFFRSVHSCVDVDFKPSFWPEGNRCPLRDGYSEKARQCVVKHLLHRTNGEFRADSNKSIEQNLWYYLTNRMNEDCFTQFSFAAYYHFFSRNQIKDVVFLMRRPVDMAVSYIHPTLGTHGKEAKAKGLDVTTLRGAELFMSLWTRTAEEYRQLKKLHCEPTLVRFDKWQSDKLRLPDKQMQLFDGFDGTPTHQGVLPREIESYMQVEFEKDGLWEDY